MLEDALNKALHTRVLVKLGPQLFEKLEVLFEWAGKTYRLKVLWAGEGWPSDVRQTLANAKGYPGPTTVVAARRLSPGAIKHLNQQDLNWMDESGSIRLIVPPNLAVTFQSQMAGSAREPKGFAWSASSLMLAEVMLNAPDGHFTIANLAKRTGWSSPQISNVLLAFDEKEWTQRLGPKRGPGVWRQLANPGSLLEAWTEQIARLHPEHRMGHRLIRDPIGYLQTELAPILGSRDMWALTGYVGLEMITPYLSAIPTLHVCLKPDLFRMIDDIVQEANIQEVELGGNIEFREAQFLLSQSGQNLSLPVVSTPRLYADLLAIGGRGVDAATHLRETRLAY